MHMGIVMIALREMCYFAMRYFFSFFSALGFIVVTAVLLVLCSDALKVFGFPFFANQELITTSIQENSVQFHYANEFITFMMRANILLALFLFYIHHFVDFMRRRPLGEFSTWQTWKIYAAIDVTLAVLAFFLGLYLNSKGQEHSLFIGSSALDFAFGALMLQTIGVVGVGMIDRLEKKNLSLFKNV